MSRVSLRILISILGNTTLREKYILTMHHVSYVFTIFFRKLKLPFVPSCSIKIENVKYMQNSNRFLSLIETKLSNLFLFLYLQTLLQFSFTLLLFTLLFELIFLFVFLCKVFYARLKLIKMHNM